MDHQTDSKILNDINNSNCKDEDYIYSLKEDISSILTVGDAFTFKEKYNFMLTAIYKAESKDVYIPSKSEVMLYVGNKECKNKKSSKAINVYFFSNGFLIYKRVKFKSQILWFLESVNKVSNL